MTATSSRRESRIRRNAAAHSIPAPAYITRKIPVYELLNEEGLVRLEDHADWILSEIGIEIRGDAVALELFREAGVSVDGERLRFDLHHAFA